MKLTSPILTGPLTNLNGLASNISTGSAANWSNVSNISTSEYMDDKSREYPKLKIYSISKIISVKPTDDGFIETHVVLSGSISLNDWSYFVVDGWPIYGGKEEWMFVSDKDSILDIPETYTDRSHLIIKTKSGLHLHQTFAFLNQQDVNHFTNEEIIKAVDEWNELLVANNWTNAISNGTLQSTLDSLWQPQNSYVKDSDGIMWFNSNANEAKGIKDYNAYYKGFELATLKNCDDLQAKIDTLGYNGDYLYDQVKELNAKVDSLSNKVTV